MPSRIAATAASVERSRSVSSMRSSIVPPILRAKTQLNRAVRAPPICRKPVGEGAKRVTTGLDIRLTAWRFAGPVCTIASAERKGGGVRYNGGLSGRQKFRQCPGHRPIGPVPGSALGAGWRVGEGDRGRGDPEAQFHPLAFCHDRRTHHLSHITHGTRSANAGPGDWRGPHLCYIRPQ